MALWQWILLFFLYVGGCSLLANLIGVDSNYIVFGLPAVGLAIIFAVGLKSAKINSSGQQSSRHRLKMIHKLEGKLEKLTDKARSGVIDPALFIDAFVIDCWLLDQETNPSADLNKLYNALLDEDTEKLASFLKDLLWHRTAKDLDKYSSNAASITVLIKSFSLITDSDRRFRYLDPKKAFAKAVKKHDLESLGLSFEQQP